MMTPDSILIRPCTTLEEFGRCVELQRLLWSPPERDLVPKEIFVVAQMVGGHVLGAFEGAELIGFTLASPGLRSGQNYLYAHMTGILPAYQDADVRRQLRLVQREEALAQGFELVEWTFEPLAWEDAHFNLESLGVVVRRLERGYYGHSTTRRLAGLPPARLVAEWWLQTPRVEATLSGQPPQLVPGRPRVSVPGGGDLRETDQAQAERIQLEVEGQLAGWLEKGYTIVGFERSREAGTYLLEAHEA